MGEGETSGTLVWLKIRPQRGMLRNTYHSTESFGDEKGYKEVVIAEAHGSDEAVRCAVVPPQRRPPFLPLRSVRNRPFSSPCFGDCLPATEQT